MKELKYASSEGDSRIAKGFGKYTELITSARFL